MNALDHPNIIRLFQVVDTVNRLYLFMEYAARGTLENILSERGKIQPTHAMQCIRYVCRGLQYMHEKNFVHRDIKPANIFVCNDGVAKLGDFGFATSCAPDELLTDRCGSLPFLAPEVLLSASGYHGPPVDLWAVGVMLYLMVTGTMPYNVVNVSSLQRDMRDQDKFLPPMATLEINLQRSTDLLTGLLQYNPTHRFSASQALSSGCFDCQDNVSRDHGSVPKEREVQIVRQSQHAKRTLISLGAELKQCCSSTVLSNPRNDWTGTYRAVFHSEQLKQSISSDKSDNWMDKSETWSTTKHGRAKKSRKRIVANTCALI